MYPVQSIWSSQLSFRSQDSQTEATEHEAVLTNEQHGCDIEFKSVETKYSWLILAASFFCHALLYGVIWTVGVYHVVFLEVYGQGAGPTSWIGAINNAFFYFAGPISSILQNKFGCRPVMIAGTFLTTFGLIISSFSTSIYHLYVTFGLLTGLGLGISYVPSITVLGEYFDVHRTIAFGVGCSGVGIGTFVFPKIIRVLVKTYGWRGSLFMMAGISFNMMIFAMFMVSRQKTRRQVNTRNEKEWTERHKNLVNAHILIRKRFMLLSANNVLLMAGVAVVYVHLSNYAKVKLNFDDDTSAMLFAYMGVANFVGRLFFGLIGHHPKINIILAYSSSTSTAAVATLLVPLVNSFAGFLCYAVAFGFFTGCIGTYLPDIIIIYLHEDFLASGYGFLLIYEGFGSLLGAPLAGWLYDMTVNYDISFYVGGAIMAFSVILLLPTYKCMRPSDERMAIANEKEKIRIEKDQDMLLMNNSCAV